ncbi:MAG: hypothetical protein H7643_10750 [Candidatus Heimdallarchaeota archaeon]|nr:hypothetical protein [Candidatus Heimdallarchaeota archaeon]
MNGEDLEIMVYRQLDAPFGMSQPDYVDLTEDGVLDIVIVVQGQGVYAIDGADLADDIWFYPDISYKPFVGVKAIPFVEKPLVAVVNFDEIFLLDSTGSLYAIDHTTHNECGSPITMLNIQSTPSGFVLVAGTHNGYVVTLDNPLVDTPYMHLSSLGVEADSMIDQPSDSLWKDKGSVLILGVIPIVALVVLLRKKK